MAAGQAPLFAAYPEGFPAAFAAGRALSLRLFIPPIDDDIHFKERVRAKCVLVGPPCPVCKGGKHRPQMYNTKRTTNWEEHVGRVAFDQLRTIHLENDFKLPIEDCRVIVVVRYTLRKPSSYAKSVVHHTRKPDVDNLAKGLLDGLVKGGILGDDNLITDEYSMKRYPEPGHPVGVEVDLTAIPL